ncbi:MAG: dipeptide epimerase [Methanobacteriota archaeon]|nr:MAG: dipeptide epimerase [Euryarchaeota archaeon]
MIDHLTSRSYLIKRKNVFRIATSASDVEDNIMVRVEAEGEFGVGNASPSDVTHETRGSIEAFLEQARGKIAGMDETNLSTLHDALESIASGNTSAKAAIDMAVYDLLGKREGKPLFGYLGGSGDGSALTDMTIGIEDEEETVRRATRHCREGFRALKLKVGLDLEGDVRRMSAVRDAIGPSVEMRVDANQGFTVEEALVFCEEMHALDVVLVEQPVAEDDYTGLKKVRERSPVPIMADECLRTVADAKRVAAEGAADIINIKLMKSGGVFPALAIDDIARDAGIITMVGCMGEIQQSIAAGLHFALGRDNVRFVDLDSHFSMIDDPSSGLEFKNGRLRVSGLPGLGMATDMDETGG